ncbi:MULTISPECIES: SRPBCC domain-containing protein [unclassified Burkholderia]|uniref:SRPBCC domain-containing protein n=2 Tax=Burkholderia TaxID=32008 RepID=UPI0014955328|nr:MULTISPECIES: SRPBCC domain-containing protein [unclassified Burkholderia]
MVAGNRLLLTAFGYIRTFDTGVKIVHNRPVRGCNETTTTNHRANMGLRRLLLKGIVVSVVGVIGSIFFMHQDGSARADVLIDRPPTDVWKIVSNSAAYPEWNPFITRVDGDFREGETIRIVLGTEPDSMVFKPTVLLVRPEQELCWRGSLWIRGVFDGTHCIRLTAVAGGTHLEQTESFSGLLVGRLTKDVIGETRRNFQAMNAALKQRAESQTP